MEQITIFDLMEQESGFPCDCCIFDKKGCCSHISDEDFFCVLGSFRIKPEDTRCTQCGKTMEVIQRSFDSDAAQCRCGLVKIFNNRGNRKTSFELWKEGRLIGT